MWYTISKEGNPKESGWHLVFARTVRGTFKEYMYFCKDDEGFDVWLDANGYYATELRWEVIAWFDAPEYEYLREYDKNNKPMKMRSASDYVGKE